jgi:hypothetical protein
MADTSQTISTDIIQAERETTQQLLKRKNISMIERQLLSNQELILTFISSDHKQILEVYHWFGEWRKALFNGD